MDRGIQLLFKCKMRQFLWSADAHAATEYAILLALLVLGSMAIIQQIGEDFFNIYTNVTDTIDESTGD